MTLQEILQDFESQRESVQKAIQTLQTQLQEQNQLFLKLDGAVDAAKLIIANFEVPVQVDADVDIVDAELTTTPLETKCKTRKIS